MKPCWQNRGLTEAGAEAADKALPLMLAALDACGLYAAAESAFAEAIFRHRVLPTRLAAFRRRYLSANGYAPKKRGDR